MSSQRPCLACGHDSSVEASHCGRCGAELRAFSQGAGVRALAASAVTVAARRGLILALAAAAVVALAYGTTRIDWGGEDAVARATWRRPDSVARWASEALARAGLGRPAVRAIEVATEPLPRRVLVVETDGRQSAPRSVRAVAKLLLEARDGGEATGIHVARLTWGDGPPLTMAAGEARRLAGDDAALAGWLEARGLPLHEDAESEDARGAEGEGPAESGGDAEPAEDGDESADGVRPPTGEATGSVPPPAPAEGAATPAAAPVEASPRGGGPAGAAEQPAATGPAPQAGARAEEAGGAARTPDGKGADGGARTGAKKRDGNAEKAAPARPPVPVRLLRGAGPAYPVEAARGSDRVVVLRAQIHPGARRSLLFDSLTVSSIGSASEIEDVDEAHLYRDANRDGLKGDDDPRLGEGTAFEANDGTVTWEGIEAEFGADGSPIYLLVAFDFLDASNSPGGTLTVSVPAATAVVVREKDTGAPCPVAGAPLQGASLSVADTRPGKGPPEGVDGSLGSDEP